MGFTFRGNTPIPQYFRILLFLKSMLPSSSFPTTDIMGSSLEIPLSNLLLLVNCVAGKKISVGRNVKIPK